MTLTQETVILGLIKLLLLALGSLYAGLVFLAYRTDDPRYPLHLDWRQAARTAERLLVRLGVKTLEGLLCFGSATFALLTDASAEVGEWFIRRRGGDFEAAIRSRFL